MGTSWLLVGLEVLDDVLLLQVHVANVAFLLLVVDVRGVEDAFHVVLLVDSQVSVEVFDLIAASLGGLELGEFGEELGDLPVGHFSLSFRFGNPLWLQY